MRTRKTKPVSAPTKRTRTRTTAPAKVTVSAAEASRESANEKAEKEGLKPSKAYGTFWIAMVVVNNLDGVDHPVRDIVSTRATNMGSAIRNIGAHYNHARRVDATTLHIIMIMPFSEFITRRMCIDYESMPMLEHVEEGDELPEGAVEEIHRISKMTREQINEEINRLYAAEWPIREDRPLAPERPNRGIGTALAEETDKRKEAENKAEVAAEEAPTPRKRTRKAATEAEQPRRRRRPAETPTETSKAAPRRRRRA